MRNIYNGPHANTLKDSYISKSFHPQNEVKRSIPSARPSLEFHHQKEVNYIDRYIISFGALVALVAVILIFSILI